MHLAKEKDYIEKENYVRLYAWWGSNRTLHGSEGDVIWIDFLREEQKRINDKPGRHAVIAREDNGSRVSLYVNSMEIEESRNKVKLRAKFPKQFAKAYPETNVDDLNLI